MKNGIKVGEHTTNKQLTLQNATRNTAGNYSCIVDNQVGKKTDVIQLQVNCKSVLHLLCNSYEDFGLEWARSI